MGLVFGFTLIFALILVANLADSGSNRSLKQALHWLLALFNGGVLLVGLILVVTPAGMLAEAELVGFTNFRPAGVIIILLAVWGFGVTTRPVRYFLARWTAILPDSSVHTIALIMAAYLVGQNALTLSQGGIQQLAQTVTAVSILDVVTTQLMFVMAAVLGVGLLTRRSPLALLERLNLAWPTGKQVVEAAGWVLVLVILQAVAGAAWVAIDPEQAELLERVSLELLGDMDTVGEWFVLALAAGVGEEILFRGALQPVFGLGVTSLIFAFAHVQYGLSPATLFIFILGFILGLVRRRTNTTTVLLVHFGYDFVLGLIALALPYLENV